MGALKAEAPMLQAISGGITKIEVEEDTEWLPCGLKHEATRNNRIYMSHGSAVHGRWRRRQPLEKVKAG